MRTMRGTAILAATLTAAACGASPAWALAGGGFAPGGPMSGSMRPSCDGYNMDGTRNIAPDADRPGCVDHSARGLNPWPAPGRPRYR